MIRWFRLFRLVLLSLATLCLVGSGMVACGVHNSLWSPDSKQEASKSMPPQSNFSLMRRNIINGEEDSSLPAVGALVIEDFAFCTGTLIAKRIVATAAHCVDAIQSYGSTRVNFRIDIPDENDFLDSKSHELEKLFVHPKYSPNRTTDFSDYDIALLILKNPVTETPVIEPYLEAIPSSWLGQTVKIMGYGVIQTYPNEVDSNEKRSVEIPLHKLNARSLVHFDEKTEPTKRKSACHGDSGGPVLFQVNGAWRLIAVNSAAYEGTPSPNGGTYCDGGTSSTRLDANYNDFISSILVNYGDQALPCQGNQCGDCETCQNNQCVPKTISVENTQCKACRSDSDCGDGLCLRLGDVFRCVQSCTGSGCCPKEHTCQPKQGLSRTTKTVCLPQKVCPALSCQSDTDCGSTEECKGGACVLKPPTVHPKACRQCTQPSDCGEGNFCTNAVSGLGYCVQRCLAGNLCPQGFQCKEVMPGIQQCMPEQICRPICSDTNPCPTGYQCNNGQCFHPKGGQVGDFCNTQNRCDARFNLQTLQGHTGIVHSVVFSPDGSMFATGSADNTVKLWDAKTNKLLFTLQDHTGAVYSVAFAPDGKTLASGSADKTVKLWDAATGKLLQTLSEHNRAVRSVAFSPSLSSSLLASGSEDTMVMIWSGSSTRKLSRKLPHPGPVYALAFQSDKYLAAGGQLPIIHLFDISAPKPLFKILPGHKGTIRSLAFNSVGTLLLSGSDDKTVRAWKMLSGKPYQRALDGFADAVYSVAFSNNNENFIGASVDQTLRIWQGYDSTLIRTSQKQPSAIHSIAHAPNTNVLVSGLANGNIVVWGCFNCGYDCVLTDEENFTKRCLTACNPPPQPEGKLGGPCSPSGKCDVGLLCYTNLVGNRVCVEACKEIVPGVPNPTSKCKRGGVCKGGYGKGKSQCRCSDDKDCPQGMMCSTALIGKLQGTGICQPKATCPNKLECKSLYQKPYGQFCVPSSPENPSGAVCSLMSKCEDTRSTCLLVRRGQSLSICAESCSKTKGQCKYGGTCESGDPVCYCKEDSDCASNRKCRPVLTDSKGNTKGVCAVPEGEKCVDNGDCITGYSCFYGKCHFGKTPPPEPMTEPVSEAASEPTTQQDAGAEVETEPTTAPDTAAPEPTTQESKPEPTTAADASPDTNTSTDTQSGGGCGCSTAPSQTPPLGTLLLFAILGLGWTKRRWQR